MDNIVLKLELNPQCKNICNVVKNFCLKLRSDNYANFVYYHGLLHRQVHWVVLHRFLLISIIGFYFVFTCYIF